MIAGVMIDGATGSAAGDRLGRANKAAPISARRSRFAKGLERPKAWRCKVIDDPSMRGVRVNRPRQWGADLTVMWPRGPSPRHMCGANGEAMRVEQDIGRRVSPPRHEH